MLTIGTGKLELMEVWLDSDPEHTRLRVTFPINKWAGSRDTAVVYFEIEPGNRLAPHTDSAEEILYLISGQAEAEVGDERGRLAAGELAVIPAMVPTVSSTPATKRSRWSASSRRPRSSRASTSRSSRSAPPSSPRAHRHPSPPRSRSAPAAAGPTLAAARHTERSPARAELRRL